MFLWDINYVVWLIQVPIRKGNSTSFGASYIYGPRRTLKLIELTRKQLRK